LCLAWLPACGAFGGGANPTPTATLHPTSTPVLLLTPTNQAQIETHWSQQPCWPAVVARSGSVLIQPKKGDAFRLALDVSYVLAPDEIILLNQGSQAQLVVKEGGVVTLYPPYVGQGQARLDTWGSERVLSLTGGAALVENTNLCPVTIQVLDIRAGGENTDFAIYVPPDPNDQRKAQLMTLKGQATLARVDSTDAIAPVKQNQIVEISKGKVALVAIPPSDKDYESPDQAASVASDGGPNRDYYLVIPPLLSQGQDIFGEVDIGEKVATDSEPVGPVEWKTDWDNQNCRLVLAPRYGQVTLRRVNVKTLRELVENYQDVEDLLAGTKYEWMLSS